MNASQSLPKVYVASRLENWPKVKEIQNKLISRGLVISHDWASLAEKAVAGFIEIPDNLSRIQINAIMSSKALLLFTPGGRGAHVESDKGTIDWTNNLLPLVYSE